MTPLCFCACLFQSESVENEISSSQICLIPISAQTLGKIAIASMNGSSDENRIDLDTIKGSVVRYFMIQNMGSTNVNDVEIVSDNPDFFFSPSKIGLLGPAKDLNVQQIITLTIKNGSKSAGGGYDSVLKAGLNEAGISISGTTIDKANNVLALSDKIMMTVYVKRAEINAIDSQGAVDLFHPWAKIWSTRIFPDPYPCFSVHGDSMTLGNTGNVDLKVAYWQGDGSSLSGKVELKIKVNGTAKIPLPSTIAFDGGATSDPAKFPIASDGKTYVMFKAYWELPPPPTPR